MYSHEHTPLHQTRTLTPPPTTSSHLSQETLTKALSTRTFTTEEMERLFSILGPESPMEQGADLTNTTDFPGLPPASKRPIDTSSSSESEPLTDSEIFTLVKPSKGRKHRKVAPKNPPTKTSPAPTTTQNRFEPLNKIRPPPIILPPHYTEVNSLVRTLNNAGISKYTVQRCKDGNKIFAQDLTTFETIKTKLTTNKTQFYSFTPKGSPKNQNFVLLGLDIDHPLESVKQQLNTEHLVSVKRMSKTQTDGTRVPIPPIILTFDHKFNPSHLKSIKSIDQIIVYIKPYRGENSISQCFRCQRFGHTRNNCNLRERCVRCGNSHASKDCDRANNSLKCPNCQEEHPASYRQCPTRLNLLEKSRKARQTTVAPPANSTPTRTYRTVDPTFSYSNAFTGLTTQLPPPPPPPTQPLPQRTQNTRPALLPTPPTPPIYQIPTPIAPQQHTSDSTPAWVERLTNTMTDMMSMIRTLVELMTKLITK